MRPELVCAGILASADRRRALSTSILHYFGPPVDKRLVLCSSWDELAKSLARRHPVLVVLEYPRSDVGIQELKELCDLASVAAKVVWLSDDRSDHVVQVLREGYEDILLADEVDSTVVGTKIDSALTRPVVSRFLNRVPGTLPAELSLYLQRLLRACRRTVRTDEAVEMYPASRRTLQKDLSAAGLPSLGKLIGWFRLLHAAHLLEARTRGVEQVALALDFPSRSALYNQMTRYAGIGPKELQRAGGLDHLLVQFFALQRPNQ